MRISRVKAAVAAVVMTAATVMGAPPSPGRSTRLFETARGVVSAWGSEGGRGAGAKGEGDAAGVAGVAVQVRMGGEVWGRAARWGGPREERGAEGMIERVVRSALAQADERLPGAADALRDSKRAAVAPTLTLSVEFAGELVPVLPRPGTLEELDLTLSPGVDGVAVRRKGAGGGGGSGEVEPVFPGEMAAFNQVASQAARSAMARLLGDAAKAVLPLEELCTREGLEVCTFRTTHVVQVRAGEELRFMRRGDRPVALTDVAKMADMAAMGQRMADHLARRLALGSAGAGVYNAAIDRYEPVAGGDTATSEMLAIWALVRWSGCVQAARPLSPLVAIEMITACAARLPVDAASGKDGTFHGAMMLALSEVAGARGACSDEQRRVATELAGNLLRTTAPLARAGKEGPTGLGLLASTRALTRGGVGGGGREGAEGLRPAIAAALAAQPAGQLAGAMPFLGLAVIEASGDLGEGIGADPAAAGVPALRGLRAELNDHQLRAGAVRDADFDLFGGVAFNAASNPRPTWHTARTLIVQGRMLGDDRYTTKDELATEVMRVMAGMRFVRQLQCDERNAWMHASPGTALGGIRAAVWEQRLPIEATASGLLAVVEGMEGVRGGAGR